MLSALPKTFVAIVESGSITGAADDLNLAKSAVSQNLKRLEEQLDVKLATRTTRRLTPTPAGERYYKKCKELLALSQQAQTEMEDYGASPSGAITITAPHALISSVLAPALASITQHYPALEPRIIADDKKLDLVADGIDVAISVGELRNSSLRAQRVGTLHDMLYITPQLLKDAPTWPDPAFIDWIEAVPYIAHVREPANINHQLSYDAGKTGATFQFRPAIRANTIEAIAAFARSGMGVAFLPDIGISDDLAKGRLVPISHQLQPSPIPIYALHAYDTRPPKSIKSVIEAIRQTFKVALKA